MELAYFLVAWFGLAAIVGGCFWCLFAAVERRDQAERLRYWRRHRERLAPGNALDPSAGEPVTLDDLRRDCSDVTDYLPEEFTREGCVK